MASVLTYWHTLRHLRSVQFYGRIWFRLARPKVDVRPAPPLRKRGGLEWSTPARRRASLLGPMRFQFLNEVHELVEGAWDAPGRDKLWTYNLHYFDDLNASRSRERSQWHHALLLKWVGENQPGIGTGWEPYPTSLRIVNWIKWSYAGNTLPSECVESLAVQARFLSRRLEIHLLGNHLFANAKALVFAGLYFEGAEADSWLSTGLQILTREVPEQILADGGHFERSTMYHALALEDVLDLVNVTRQYPSAIPSEWKRSVEGWSQRVDSMRDWLSDMSHPDGEIGFFNDAAFGIAPPRSELERYALELGFRERRSPNGDVVHLAASGYVRVERGDVVALLDLAPVGPDYLPGHAHADTLSFELSLFGRRVLVNSGTSRYGSDGERVRQRGTAAHNTVLINGEDSSEVWSGFRVARRARVLAVDVESSPIITVRGTHDGYERLAGKPRHEREWRFDERTLLVEDRVSGQFESAEARFHLDPSLTVTMLPEDSMRGAVAIVALHDGHELRVSTEGGVLRAEKSTWHPEFGKSEPSVLLAVQFSGSVLRTLFSWSRE